MNQFLPKMYEEESFMTEADVSCQILGFCPNNFFAVAAMLITKFTKFH